MEMGGGTGGMFQGYSGMMMDTGYPAILRYE
jgi:hypothetical protein